MKLLFYSLTKGSGIFIMTVIMMMTGLPLGECFGANEKVQLFQVRYEKNSKQIFNSGMQCRSEHISSKSKDIYSTSS